MQKHENSRSVEELLNIKEYKKTCKTCKQADEYLIIKAQENEKKKYDMGRRKSMESCTTFCHRCADEIPRLLSLIDIETK